jgi:predicted amidohydrolase YtcJ
MRYAYLAATLAFCLIATPASSESPDHVFLDGKVITVDPFFSIQEAFAVRGSRIQAVGSSDDMRQLAGPETEVVDLEGQTVIPGLIDTHVHFVRASQYWMMEVRLDDVTSREEALERIRERAEQEEPGAFSSRSGPGATPLMATWSCFRSVPVFLLLARNV